MLVNFKKREIHFYHGKKGEMVLEKDPMKFDSTTLYFSVSFGDGVCMICEDAEIPNVIPPGYEVYLKFSPENYKFYSHNLKTVFHLMLKIRNFLNKNQFKANKIPRNLLYIVFQFCLEISF